MHRSQPGLWGSAPRCPLHGGSCSNACTFSDLEHVLSCPRLLSSSAGTAVFQELLAERRSRSCPLSLCQRLGRVAVLLLAWVLSLGTVLGCVVAVHYLLEHMHVVSAAPTPRCSSAGLGRALQADRRAAQPEEAGAALLHLHSRHSEPQRTGLQAVRLTQAPACQVQQEHRALAGSTWQREGILLVLPLTVSLLNTLMSHLYNLLAICERQDSPAVEVYVAICRWAAWGRGRGAPSHWLAVGRGPGAGGPPYVGFSPSA